MLATTTKPHNPNKKDSLDTDWDKLDLCSFLRNINIINIDENDISYTGKDYTNATNREIVAEIIRTINATHYNSLLGMKDIINYNNKILQITESRNKSIAICNKKIKYFEANLNRIRVLLTKAAHTLPAGSLIDYQNMEKAQNILNFTCCNDLTFTRDDFKYNNIINTINKPILELNINNTKDTIKNITIPTDTNDKIESLKVESADIKDYNTKPIQKPPKHLQPRLIQPLVVNIQNVGAISRGKIITKNEPQMKSSTNQSITILSPIKPHPNDIKTDTLLKPNEPSPKQIVTPQQQQLVQTEYEINDTIKGDLKDPIVKQIQKSPEQIQLSNLSTIPIGTIGGAINNDTIEPTQKSLKQAKHPSHPSYEQNLQCETAEIVNIVPITQNPTANLRESKNIKNKSQSKSKSKLKKVRKKNKNKNNKKKQKKKKKLKPKRHKQKKLNILNMEQINEMIMHYEFSDDEYQDWMNLRMSKRSGLSAYDYYEENNGPITDDLIKEWSSVYYSN